MTTTSPEPTDVDAGAQAASPTTVSPTAAVAAGLAVEGLDLTTARAVVDARARRRIRSRRGALAGTAAVAVLAVALVLIPRDEPNDVIADADNTTTTEATSTTSPPETVPVTAAPPVTAAVTTTVKKPVTTLPPLTTIPPPTLPPNRALTASLATPTAVAVGETVTLEVTWSDADMADPAGPRGTAAWGDLNVTTPISAETRPPCEVPGAAATGTLPLQFRYSRPGTYPVTVQLRTCDGVGAYAENLTLNTTVTVNAVPESNGVANRGVVLTGPLGGPSPDGSQLTYTATSGVAPQFRDAIPNLGLISTRDGAPATVVVVPTNFVGSVRAVQSTVCQTGAFLDTIIEFVPLSGSC